MEHREKELEKAYDKASRSDHQLISVLFTDEKTSDIAIDQLSQRGYPRKDIKILMHQRLFDKPCLVVGETEDSNKVIVKKAVNGLKIGAIIGIVIASVLILSMASTAQPGLFEIILIPVGAISGAVLGFLLGPLLPLSQHQYYRRDLIDGNVLIQFWIKSRKERTYFKKMKWTICQLGVE